MASGRYHEGFDIFRVFSYSRSIVIWVDEWSNSVVHFWCDNQAVVHIVNSLISHSERVMALVRAFTLWALKFNILIQAWHVPGVDNNLADALAES